MEPTEPTTLANPTQAECDESFAEQGVKAYFPKAEDIRADREAGTITFKLVGGFNLIHGDFCEERRGLQLVRIGAETKEGEHFITLREVRFPPPRAT